MSAKKRHAVFQLYIRPRDKIGSGKLADEAPTGHHAPDLQLRIAHHAHCADLQLGLDLAGEARQGRQFGVRADAPLTKGVEVAGEGDAFLGDLPEVREAHHLVAATVGKNGFIPTIELVKPTCLLQNIGAGT